MEKKAMAILIIPFAVVILIFFVSKNVVGPIGKTYTTIEDTSLLIVKYVEENRNLPKTLTALPKEDGYKNQFTDGWNQELSYKIKNNNTVSLTSYGQDGKVGGLGNDADITRMFSIENRDDKIKVDDSGWVINAETKKKP